MRSTIALLLIAALGATARAADEAAPTGEEQPIADPAPVDLEEILSNPLDDDDYRERSACVWRRTVEHVEVLDETLVVFEGRRGELWLNQLSSQCYGLEADMILQFKVRGGSYCNLDSFRGIPKYDLVPVTAQCTLGSFATVDEVQLEAIRIAVDERRKVQDMARETRRQERRRSKRND